MSLYRFLFVRRIGRPHDSAVLILGLLFFVLGSSAVYAATPADIQAAQRQAEILQKQEQLRLESEREELRRRTESVEGMDTESLTPNIKVPEIGASCREVSKINIKNATKISAEFRAYLDKEYTGRCLKVVDIEGILAAITKYYIDLGFVTTRAYLPQQDLNTGQLQILVVEGLIEQIDVEDGEAKSVSIKNVFPKTDGEMLNLRDLEQGIDQINRLASNNARLDIQPGGKPGTSRVVVQNIASSPYHFNITVDNQGSKSTGRTQLGLFASADNLLGYNDSLSLTHRQSVMPDFNHENSLSDNLNFSMPFGYNTLYAGASYSQYDSQITLPSTLKLTSSGSNTNYNLRLDRVMYRDQSTRASLSGMLTLKQSRNYLAGEFLDISSRKLTVFDLDSHFNTGFAGGVLGADIGYAIGLSAFDALDDPNSLPETAPHAQFTKLKFGLNYARTFSVFDKSISFSSQLTGQKATDTLFGSEQISIGGIYTVRGFVSNTLSGDDGYYWRNELSTRYAIPIEEHFIPARFYLAFDMGKVANRVDGIPQGRLTGMAVGMSGSWKSFSWDIFNSRPLTLPDTFTKESSETWFRITHSI